VVCARSMTLTPPASAAVVSPLARPRVARCAATSDDEHAVSVLTQGPCQHAPTVPQKGSHPQTVQMLPSSASLARASVWERHRAVTSLLHATEATAERTCGCTRWDCV